MEGILEGSMHMVHMSVRNPVDNGSIGQKDLVPMHSNTLRGPRNGLEMKMRKVPDYRYVKSEVASLLDEYGIDRPPVNPVQIAKDKGFDVKFVRFTDGYEGVSGFFDPEDGTIFVNKDEAPLRQTFTVAHELAHALLHKDWAGSESYRVFWRDMSRNVDDPHEKEANAFAAHLLVPRHFLDAYYAELTPAQLSRLFAVSVPTISNRLTNEYGI
jgi:IrrE N-terminal-like domain